MRPTSSSRGFVRTGKRQSAGIDWLLLISYLALVVIGLLMVYTTTYNDNIGNMWTLSSPFGSQLLWAILSLVVLIVLSLFDWQIWNSLSLPAYIVGIVLLVLLLLIGNEIKGAKSWISLGPFSFQPGEFAKVATALFSASLLSSVHTKLSEYKSQLLVLGVMALPALLIILQPDPGSALTFASLIIAYYRFGMPVIYYLAIISLFLTIVFSLTQGFYVVASAIFLIGVLFTSRFSIKETTPIFIFAAVALANILFYQFDLMPYAVAISTIYLLVHLFMMNRSQSLTTRFSVLGGLSILCLISFSSSFAFNNLLKPHQQDRINVWLQPEKCDPRGSLYNLIQSKIAIGSGGLSGKGYLNGNLTKLNYVPEQTTDFIFSSIGEEQGFLGGAGVVIIFLLLTIRIIRVGENSNFSFIKAYCYIIAGFIFTHFFINIGMTMGLSPVIGIPLPFISKGGTALMAFSMMIGITINMSKETR